jgi:glycosyltransferase involved in cell wall biosynthesis
MRIIVCHNFYQQPGGEDQVFADECELLASHGHEVTPFVRHNDNVNDLSRLRLAASTIWNRQTCRELSELVRQSKADVVHFHNTLPLISPAAFRAARRAGAAVVLTLHNYRLMCPKATFYRAGQTCEDCLGRVPWAAIRHKCYRDSRLASATVAAMTTAHWAIGTYRSHIDAYIALCEFSRQKHIAGGIPADRIELKPNFCVLRPPVGSGDGGYVMFLGRLAPDKGITTLLQAWQQHSPSIPLTICGNGPEAPAVQAAVAARSDIRWVHDIPRDQVMSLLGGAAAMLLPSVNYEGFPKTIVEAYSLGTPVIASRLGAMIELIHPGQTGYLVPPGDAAALARCVRESTADPRTLRDLRPSVQELFENNYTADSNYPVLMGIYERALARRHNIERDGDLSGPDSQPDKSPARSVSIPTDVSMAVQSSASSDGQLVTKRNR